MRRRPEKAKAPVIGPTEAFKLINRTSKNGIKMKDTAKDAAAQVQAAVTLPPVGQVVLLAICKAERSLQRLVDQRIADEHWDEVDVYVDFGVELALSHVARMKSMVFGADCAFDREWFKAAGALNLGKAVFSRKDCAYFRMLESACEMFDQLAGLVEFSEKAV